MDAEVPEKGLFGFREDSSTFWSGDPQTTFFALGGKTLN